MALKALLDVLKSDCLPKLMEPGQMNRGTLVSCRDQYCTGTDPCKCMTFKVLKYLNLIGTMKIFTKPNCKLCMEERLMRYL